MQPFRVLGLDFETTGFDPLKDKVIEVGAVLFDWDRKIPVDIYSQLVDPKMPIPEVVTGITGITDEDVRGLGAKDWSSVKSVLGDMLSDASAIMIHNAEFDTQWWNPNNEEGAPQHLIIDTMHDLPLEAFAGGSRKLKYMAADHGFVNPFTHRAVFDVLTMLNVASRYPLESILLLAKSPKIRVKAMVSYNDRQKAKDAGFRWDGDTKSWVMDMKEIQYKPEAFSFQTTMVRVRG